MERLVHKFTLSTFALVTAVVRKMLKTRVTLGNISRVLLSLSKRYINILSNLFKSIFNWEEFIYRTFEDCIGLFNSHYCFFYFRISARKYPYYYGNFPEVSGHFFIIN